MIRFIDLGKQIGLDEEWPREFAFFNTVTDTFMEFGGSQTWESWDDFCDDFAKPAVGQLERLKRLCPEWVFQKHPIA